MAEYIDRNLLLMGVDGNISNMKTKYGGNRIADYAINLVQLTRDYIAAIPAANVAPVVHGRWREADDGDGAVCSVCGEDFCNIYLEVDRFKYCPNCGARMDGE